MPQLELYGEPKRAIFLARYSRDLRIDARTGQDISVATFAANAPLDSWSAVGSSIANEPCWYYDSTKERMFLELDDGTERLTYDFPLLPRAMSGLIEFTATSTSDELLRIGTHSTGNASIEIDHNGTAFAVVHHNGTASVTSTATLAIADNSFYTVRWSLDSTGKVQIWAAKDGAAEVAGSLSGAPSGNLAAAWSSELLHVVCFDGAGTANTRVGLVAISADPDATLVELQNLF